MAEETPNFVIQGQSFNVIQNNVYKMAIVEQELSETEILQILKEKHYQYSEEFVMENNKYSYWLYLVDNKNDKPQKIFLRFPMQMPVSKAWLYQGDHMLPFDRYPVIYDMFHSEIPPGRSLIVGMRLSGGNVKGRAKVVSIQDFASSAWKVTKDQIIMGGIFGAVTIMVLYNLGMLLFFRRIYFLYYSIYSAASTYSLAILSGFSVWSLRDLGVSLAISGTALLLFCNSALSLSSDCPRLYRISRYLLVYCAAFGIFIWFKPDWNVIALSMPLILLFCIYSSILRARDGFRPAIYLVIGWGALMITATLSIINVTFFGWESLGHITVYGFAVELCFFSFAVAQKVRLAEQKVLRESEHAFNQLKKVFYPHQIHQIKAGIELEKTMPTGKERAAVISFDIVESSQIQQPHAKEFIENSIKSCVSIISENYDPDSLRANGYRIKEVGDGFLCSVGYPFPLPNGLLSEECAVDLGLRFISIFQKEVEKLQNHPPIYCSIGIAIDALEGYFPKVGTIEYDVYGRAIILATRYESFRRQLFPTGVPGHILTLHEKIYKNLPAGLRACFVEVDLQKQHLVVRDDLDASKLYYRVIQPEQMDQLKKTAGR